MRKISKTLVATMIIVATVATFLVGCKKEQIPEAIETRQDKTTLDRIMDFKQQLETVKEVHDEKDVSYMSIADAVWNLEALFNLTYAYPDDYYAQTVCRDTTLYLPICANDSVLMNDLSVFYDKLFETVQDIYRNIELDDKQFLILDLEAGQRNGSQLSIVIHTVQGSVETTPSTPTPPAYPWPGPFEEGVSWFYGENGGNSNYQFFNVMDAADTLSRVLNARLVSVAPEGYLYYYTNVKMKELGVGQHCTYSNSQYPDLGPYCEFYKENPTGNDFWLNSDQMNFHYFGERYLVLNYFRNNVDDPIPSTHSLFQVYIGDYHNDNVIGHHTQARYGHREVLAQEVIVKGSLDND